MKGMWTMNQCSLIHVIGRLRNRVEDTAPDMPETLVVCRQEEDDDARVGQGCTQPLHFRESDSVTECSWSYTRSGRARQRVEIILVQDFCYPR